VLATLGLYLMVILRSLDARSWPRTGWGPSWWSALLSGFSFQVVYNIAMSAGLAPVKGSRCR